MNNYTQLIYKYRPILYLHPREEFNPSSIDYILEHSWLSDKDGKTLVDEGKINKINLTSFNQQYGNNLQVNINSTIFKGQSYLKNVPIYYTSYLDDKYLVIQYAFLFPYNGSYKVCCSDMGQHVFDLEHITLRINLKTQQIDDIYFSAHRAKDGLWIEHDKIEFEGERPVVYLALHSHACYNRAKVWYRIWFLANDKTKRGGRWDTDQLVDLKNEDWNNFKGHIGAETTPLFRDWYKHEDGTSTNCCLRNFFPC